MYNLSELITQKIGKKGILLVKLQFPKCYENMKLFFLKSKKVTEKIIIRYYADHLLNLKKKKKFL